MNPEPRYPHRAAGHDSGRGCSRRRSGCLPKGSSPDEHSCRLYSRKRPLVRTEAYRGSLCGPGNAPDRSRPYTALTTMIVAQFAYEQQVSVSVGERMTDGAVLGAQLRE